MSPMDTCKHQDLPTWPATLGRLARARLPVCLEHLRTLCGKPSVGSPLWAAEADAARPPAPDVLGCHAGVMAGILAGGTTDARRGHSASSASWWGWVALVGWPQQSLLRPPQGCC